MKPDQNVCLDEISDEFEMGHGGSKTRSLGQMLEKKCVGFSSIIMKLGQNICLDEIPDKFEMGHVGSKTSSLGQMLEKPYLCSRGHIFCLIIMKLEQYVFFLMKSRTKLKMDHVGSKTRSLGQMLKTLPHFQSNNHETWSECLS